MANSTTHPLHISCWNNARPIKLEDFNCVIDNNNLKLLIWIKVGLFSVVLILFRGCFRFALFNCWGGLWIIHYLIWTTEINNMDFLFLHWLTLVTVPCGCILYVNKLTVSVLFLQLQQGYRWVTKHIWLCVSFLCLQEMWTLLLVSTLPLVTPFYVPGVAPMNFHQNSPVEIKVRPHL